MKSANLVAAVICSLAIAGIASAQAVISAKAGMVNYLEGKVLLDGRPAEVKLGNFPSVRNNSELRTEEGRAEMLLGPGVFVRLGENSGIRMISDRLSDTRLEFTGGSMMVERAEVEKDESIQITYKDAAVTLTKDGMYRFDSEPPRLMVYDGEAKVTQAGQTQTVKKSKLLPLEGVAVAQKFDNKSGDALFRWARRRSEYLAVANVSAARTINRNGYWGSSGWVYNPAFGLFTYVPMAGFYRSFWGYSYWSPGDVYAYYVPRRIHQGDSHSSLPTSGGGGTAVSRPPATSPSSSPTAATGSGGMTRGGAAGPSRIPMPSPASGPRMGGSPRGR